MLSATLVTHERIEACILRGERTDDPLDDQYGEVGVCPVTELIELSERIKKHSLASLVSYREGVNAIQDGIVRCELLQAVIVPLDQERLADSLFERDDQGRKTSLWMPGCDPEIRCMHSVRRLILRPTHETWWGHEVYAFSEEIYCPEFEETHRA